jgi:quercetin dioxygenase-like cupin family protein
MGSRSWRGSFLDREYALQDRSLGSSNSTRASRTSSTVDGRRLVSIRLVECPSDTYAPHVHDYDKVIVVVHGSITWSLPATNEIFETLAGDRIELPRGTWHAAEVGPRGVICLEGHIV